MVDNRKTKLEQDDRAVAIYHVVYADEGFEHAAKALFQLVQDVRTRCPGKPRRLYLDVEGHRDAGGAFDADMTELQRSFVPQVLMPFLSELHCPLAHLRNPTRQSDEMPETLIIKASVPITNAPTVRHQICGSGMTTSGRTSKRR